MDDKEILKTIYNIAIIVERSFIIFSSGFRGYDVYLHTCRNRNLA